MYSLQPSSFSLRVVHRLWIYYSLCFIAYIADKVIDNRYVFVESYPSLTYYIVGPVEYVCSFVSLPLCNGHCIQIHMSMDGPHRLSFFFWTVYNTQAIGLGPIGDGILGRSLLSRPESEPVQSWCKRITASCLRSQILLSIYFIKLHGII